MEEPTEHFPVEGEWWLPDAPAERRRGRLTSTDAGLQLDIEGSLLPGPDATAGAFSPAGHTVRSAAIHGRQLGFGRPVTALACTSDEPWLPAALHDPISSTTDWYVGAVVLGAHMASKDDHVVGLTWHLLALDDWVPDEDMTFGWTEELACAAASSRVLGQLSVDGATLTIRSGAGLRRQRRRIQIDRTMWLEVTVPPGTSLSTVLQEWVNPITDFISFATALHASPSVMRLRLPDDLAADRDAVIHAIVPPMLGYRSPSGVLPMDMPTPWGLLASRLGRVLGEWRTLGSSREAVISRLLVPARTPGMFAEDRFLTAALAAEAYHQCLFGTTALPTAKHRARVASVLRDDGPAEHVRWANQVLSNANSLSRPRQLQALLGRSNTVGAAITASLPDFVKRCVDARNATAHPGSGISGREFVYLAQGLEWVCRYILLDEVGALAGADDHVLLRHHPFEQVLRRLSHLAAL